jgi:hypothetical protein
VKKDIVRNVFMQRTGSNNNFEFEKFRKKQELERDRVNKQINDMYARGDFSPAKSQNNSEIVPRNKGLQKTYSNRTQSIRPV